MSFCVPQSLNCNYFQYSMLSLPPRPLNTQSQGECSEAWLSLQVLQRGGAGAQVCKGRNCSKELPFVSHPLQGRNSPFSNSFVPLPGATLRLHLIVVSKLWLGSCRRYSCKRQACSSATYLFKWVQKFSAS